MTSLAWGLSTATVALLMNIAIDLGLRHGRSARAWLLMLVLAGSMGYVLHGFFNGGMPAGEVMASLSPELKRLGFALHWLLAESVPVCLWLLLRHLRRGQLAAWQWWLIAGVFGLNLPVVLQDFSQPLLLTLSNGVNVVCLGLCVHELARGGAMEDRSSAGRAVLLSLLVLAAIIFLYEAANPGTTGKAWLVASRSACLLGSVLLSVAYFRGWLQPLEVLPQERQEDPAQRARVNWLEQQMRDGDFYMRANLTLPRLAAALGMSEAALRRLIHDDLGFDHFNGYINTLRVEHVAQILRAEPHRNVGELREAAGFTSHPTFNRAFRERFGCSPREYRKGDGGN